VSDKFTVPVCRVHHRELHRSGDEAAWWQKINITPLPVALTRADGEFGASEVSQAQGMKTSDVSASRSSRHEP
jgi:hypothetical protein